MRLRLFVLLLAWGVVGSSWAQTWSVCPGWDPSTATADSRAYRVFASPYTYHWSDENASDHRAVFALGVTLKLPNQRFCGASLFRNSFGQPSAYAFTGWYWPNLWRTYPSVYAAVSAGVLYGYVGRFKDKVPLNFGGFSPVLIPALGYHVTPKVSVEVQLLGTAAVMFGTHWRF